MINHFHVPVRQPEDIIPHLGKGEKHWRKGFSAYELATSWVNAHGIPQPVRNVLDTSTDYRDAVIVDGFFERQVDLRTPGRPSQTDLLVLASVPSGLAIIAVEGKVDEALGPVVGEWCDSPGKEARLDSLCETLGLDVERVGGLRYQLFHRTVSAIYEAQRYCCPMALTLVHSFSARDAGFDDFAAFVEVLGVPFGGPDTIAGPISLEGVRLSLGWVKDEPIGGGQV